MPENFIKMHRQVFSKPAKRQTDRQTSNVKTQSMLLVGDECEKDES